MTPPAEGTLDSAAQPPKGQTFVLEPRFDRPLHPLSASTWLPIHARSLGAVMRRFGLPIDGLDERVFHGRVYGRLVPLLDRGKDGPPPPDWVLRMLFRFLPPMRRRLAAAKAWDGDGPIVACLDAWDRQGRAESASRTAELRVTDRMLLSEDDLVDHLDAVLAHVAAVAERHFELSLAGTLIPTGRLGLLAEELLGWDAFDSITLVAGYGVASTAHGRAIERLAAELGPESVQAALDDPATLANHPALAGYLEAHGHSVNVELATPTEAEDLSLVAGHLRRLAATPPERRDPKVEAHDAQRRALAAIKRPEDRRRFEATLALARRGRPYGDETEAATLEALTLVRYVALEIARRLVATGRLGEADDIWFYDLDELRASLRPRSGPAPVIEERRLAHASALEQPAPAYLGPPPPPAPAPDIVPGRYRDTVGAVLWTAATEAPLPTASAPAEPSILQGAAASPGRARGTVRIVRDMSEFGRVVPGDIIVCPTTAAAWSPIFGVIGGLVTEHGGLLSHPAILSREYGLPAVLGVPDAMSRLQDGTRVEIDGSAGRVTLL